MDNEVKSAAEATQIAESVLEAYAFRRPVKAHRSGDVWHVQVDVGVFKPRIANFKIDAKTGAILKYEVPDEVANPK